MIVYFINNFGKQLKQTRYRIDLFVPGQSPGTRKNYNYNPKTRGKQGNIMLNTTQKFFEFFGLEMTKPEELKQMLAEKAGLK